MLLTALLGALGATEIASLFTDSQWGDIQSFLNFIVLVFIAYRNERKLPPATAEETTTHIRDEINNPDGLREELQEILIDAMEKRARRYPKR